MRSKTIFALALAAAALLLLVVTGASTQGTLSLNEKLGKKLLFDTNLSTPPGQACAACHGREVGYTGPDAAINAAGAVYEGAVAGRFGNRKPPAAAYAGDSPILHFDGTKWVGGMFWDGRATGSILGDPLAEQAQGPFLNPLEQNNASPEVVINKVLASNYSHLFHQVCTDSDTVKHDHDTDSDTAKRDPDTVKHDHDTDSDTAKRDPDTVKHDHDTAKSYECIGRSIAAYERSKEV